MAISNTPPCTLEESPMAAMVTSMREHKGYLYIGGILNNTSAGTVTNVFAPLFFRYPAWGTPAEFEKYFRDEAERWTKVYKESGIKLD